MHGRLPKRAALTVDVEQDCPPFLDSYRGIDEGLPLLLDLFQREAVRATFFTTGRVAERYPALVRRIPREGHELGCHGYAHDRYDRMGPAEAASDLRRARRCLEAIDPVLSSFRAPNLAFPAAYLGLLREAGFTVDSSAASYKPPFLRAAERRDGVMRIPVSLTSSLLRLPLPLISPWLSRRRELVLFVHPWEFVDLSGLAIRYDCRYNTGPTALARLTGLIGWLRQGGYRLCLVRELG
ncbi:MAG: polysaccharide deacetylase family protein [Gammaproteobacteria bacterium]